MGRELVRQLAADGCSVATCDWHQDAAARTAELARAAAGSGARVTSHTWGKAPLSPAQAATIILDGVRSGDWRILVGRDAGLIDEAVRARPEAAYDYPDLFGRIRAIARDAASAQSQGVSVTDGTVTARERA
jgi:NAD(P)-dependent dehydrogenase (short-subunit alcohol dehydrogenase family)